MSFRNRKAFACMAAVMLVATCMMFVIPESSDAVAAPAETVVIESDMDDEMSISDMILQYGSISAEKEHQESKGKNVIIRDSNPKRNDPNEQRFVDDIRYLIGINDQNHVVADNGPKDDIRDTISVHEEPRSGAFDGSKDMWVSSFVMDPVVPEIPESPVCAEEPQTADDTEAVPAESDDDAEEAEGTSADEEPLTEEYEVIIVDKFSEVDESFIDAAVEIAEKDGIDLDDRLKAISYSNKVSVALSYSEICSFDTSSRHDDDEDSDDCDTITIVEEDDDEESVLIPDEPEIIQDLFYTPVATVTVADTLCSGTDI